MNSNVYSIEIDCLSGQPNPLVLITAKEFKEIFDLVMKLDNSEPRPLFDGLGFRGFRVSSDTEEIIIQKAVIAIKVGIHTTYKKPSEETLWYINSVIGRNNTDGNIAFILKNIQPDFKW